MSREGPLSCPLIEATAALRDSVERLAFSPPVAYIYNPLHYAWETHCQYLTQYGTAPKRVLFLGMNPGPFGMAQTAVPFGEIRAVHDWMGLRGAIGSPPVEHPKRPVKGFDTKRSEISGRRLWGLFEQRFVTARAFFTDHFVANYCPLLFLEASGRNRTPDKLSSKERKPLYAACDKHLLQWIATLKPQWVIAIGTFAEKRIQHTLQDHAIRVGRILHPSPASPATNRNWAESVTAQLETLGVWG